MKKLLISISLFVLCVAVAFTALADTAASGNGSAQTDDEILEAILDHFKKLAAVPRPSHHEEKISQYLYDYAEGKGLKAERDESNNVIVDIPATPGLEGAPRIALQAHMDMVCVSDHDGYDPEKDPIEVIREGNIIRANGTSLGADDGIGVAMILCVMDGLIPHGPVRAIFTICEEDGMVGAMKLDPAHLSDCVCLINLDSEIADSVYLGCASCCVMTLTSPVETTKPAGDKSVTVRVSGLKGGHSAIVTNATRINAINVMISLLRTLRNIGLQFELASFKGGNAFNAIPKEAECEIVISEKDKEKYKPIIDEYAKAVLDIYHEDDPGLKIDLIENTQLPEKVITEYCFDKIIDCGDLLINGILSFNNNNTNDIKTSGNLGVIEATPEGLKLVSSVRSISEKERSRALTMQENIAKLNGFTFEFNSKTPIWEYVQNNPLRDLYCKAYKNQTGHLPKLETTHGGLECAYFVEAAPKLQMISIGPDIDGAHSVGETCHLDSVVTIWRALAETLLHIDECANGAAAAAAPHGSSDAA